MKKKGYTNLNLMGFPRRWSSQSQAVNTGTIQRLFLNLVLNKLTISLCETFDNSAGFKQF